MNVRFDPVSMGENVERLIRRHGALEGERRALEGRRAAVETDAGLAKGRLARKAEIDAFLEELQAEAHAKRVGDFERLLSALVSEVLPNEAPIGLDLELERGVPSLDIVSRQAGGVSEDIYDDQGGAVTNVVSMGLRMISVVRSGMRRFLMLDEADCWIKNDRVPDFYSVLSQAAGKIGVQCLAISHHDVAAFGNMRVAEVSGHPDMPGGVRISNPPRPWPWKDDEEGIRWVRLRNFQGYADATLKLGPGVNAVIGENNIGKSSFLRAFRAVFYGEARDSLVRRGEKECTVEIGFSGGRTLLWNRRPRRNPVNLWKLLGPDGAVVSDEGMTYETGGRAVPEWVPALFGIGPLEGMDVHAVKQKSPVFLLDRPGSQRAAVLSVGHESGYIRRMAALHRERCTKDSACVREGEAEVSRIIDRMAVLEGAGRVQEMIVRAKALLADVTARERAAAALSGAAEAVAAAKASVEAARGRRGALSSLPRSEAVKEMERTAVELAGKAAAADALESAKARLSAAAARSALLSGLPAVPVLAATSELAAAAAGLSVAREGARRAVRTSEALSVLCPPPVIVPSDDLIRAGRGMKDARIGLERARALCAAFGRLPGAPPAIGVEGELAGVLRGVESARGGLEAARRAKEAAMREMDGVREELEEVAAAAGGACPLCGSSVENPEALLGGHVHG